MISTKTILLTILLFLTSNTIFAQEYYEGFVPDDPTDDEPPKTLSEQIASEGHPLGRSHVEITHENMNLLLTGDWVILLYTPWTLGSMPALTYLPYLDGATAAAAPGLRYAAVDCSLYPEVHTFFPHRGYPTLLLARGGAVVARHGQAYDSEGLFGFARRAARIVSGEPAPALQVSGNRAVDEKIALVRNAARDALYRYARALRAGVDRMYVVAVGLEVSPVVFAALCGVGAVVVLVVVLMVVSLCQSDLDMLEVEMMKKKKKV